MSPIIALPIREAHPDLDAEARRRTDRLNRATAQEMHTALAFLSMIDPDAFEIAFQAVPPSRDALPDDGEPEPLCRRGCSHHCCQATSQRLAHGDRSGMPAQPGPTEQGLGR